MYADLDELELAEALDLYKTKEARAAAGGGGSASCGNSNTKKKLVDQMSLDGGQVTCHHPSLTAAAQAANVAKSTMSDTIGRGKALGGYLWRFVDSAQRQKRSIHDSDEDDEGDEGGQGERMGAGTGGRKKIALENYSDSRGGAGASTKVLDTMQKDTVTSPIDDVPAAAKPSRPPAKNEPFIIELLSDDEIEAGYSLNSKRCIEDKEASRAMPPAGTSEIKRKAGAENADESALHKRPKPKLPAAHIESKVHEGLRQEASERGEAANVGYEVNPITPEKKKYDCPTCRKTYWWTPKQHGANAANHSNVCQRKFGNLEKEDNESFIRPKDQGWGELLDAKKVNPGDTICPPSRGNNKDRNAVVQPDGTLLDSENETWIDPVAFYVRDNSWKEVSFLKNRNRFSHCLRIPANSSEDGEDVEKLGDLRQDLRQELRMGENSLSTELNDLKPEIGALVKVRFELEKKIKWLDGKITDFNEKDREWYIKLDDCDGAESQELKRTVCQGCPECLWHLEWGTSSW